VRLPYGTAIELRRRVTVSRAGLLAQWWIKLRASLELTELYEITFSSEKPR